MFVSATPPSVSALTLLPKKKMSIPEKFRCAFWGRRTTCAPTQLRSDPKKGQVDVFSLVFVSADNKNVSARLTTDLFIKNWAGKPHAAEPKAA